MIVSMFRVSVPAERAAGFEQSWRQRAGRVDSMPGFHGLEVLRDASEPGNYLVVTRWEAREDFERWASSPAFAAGHAHSGQTGGQGGGVEFYEVVES
jgi:heme-degrading monooxygenase HmoA